ncbi:hypothetical protein [Streptomyces sp. CB01580]|uniref:hypothetical protein n=1 Tax=Streptomyces sp. CB01580 TaxID=1703933 RepID=UPI00093DA91A|nr:hypothetical protein [Streptomyces sp. CB01580]OKJ34138.1 hypothetical protein AMK22_19585 [Streptomyces sp. CB01580]
MSQPVPPPNQQPGAQPVDGNPYAGQQPGAPTGNPFAGQQPGAYGQPAPAFGGAPFAPPAPPRDKVALGLVAAVVAALVGAFLYGVIAGAIEREVGYIAIGVGFLVGFAASKVGGRNPILPVVSAVLSVGAVYLGQLIGISIILSDLIHQSASTLFIDHFDVLTKAWGEGSDFMTYVFLLLGAVAAFGGAKKA